MAKKTTRKGKSQNTFLSKNTGKVLLALIATGSFAIAFGSEKISKFIPLQSSSGACLNQFYREVPPLLNKESLTKHSYALCFNDFNYTCLNQTSLDLNAEHSKLIVDLENETIKINEELKTLRETISNTLSTLSTEKRILVEFPELSNFFVTNSGVTTLALPIQSIRDILGKYDN